MLHADVNTRVSNGLLAAGTALLLATAACGGQEGSVFGWGARVTPIVEPGTRFTAIAGGGFHSLALKDNGTVVAWGSDAQRQSTVPSDLHGVTAIAAGWLHSLALKSDGTVVAWGKDSYGECTVPDGLSNVIAIAAGAFHNLALRSDGTVIAWGRDG